ncbi:MAG: hypothetical protein KME45_23235 [Stenomitos rutilans HA7619-LM2]|jgi:hypothetical protein|nr:hypothetical protein [Stenomitos rutilans HA7619-LM2]
MPQDKAPGAEVAPNNKRVQVFFGKFPKKVAKPEGGSVLKNVNLIATCRAAVAEALNLKTPVAGTDDVNGDEDGKKTNVFGSKNGKTIIVTDPLLQKTPKKGIRTYSVQVPTNATVPEIKQFLKTGGKAKTFKIKGGRSYTVG